jgi:hypothetical protein
VVEIPQTKIFFGGDAGGERIPKRGSLFKLGGSIEMLGLPNDFKERRGSISLS